MKWLLIGLLTVSTAQADIMFCHFEGGDLGVRNVIDNPQTPVSMSWVNVISPERLRLGDMKPSQVIAHVVTKDAVVLSYETTTGERLDFDLVTKIRMGRQCSGPWGVNVTCSDVVESTHEGNLRIESEKFNYDGKVTCKFQYVGIQ